MNQETLHEIIGADIVETYNKPPSTRVLLDPACGGHNQISLYSRLPKSRGSKFCCPDIVICRDDAVRVVIEIEDNGKSGKIGPAKIGGKLLPAALAKHLLHPEVGMIAIRDYFALVQIANTATLQPRTRRYEQYDNLAEDIRRLVPLGSVGTYYLIPTLLHEFRSENSKARDDLRSAIDLALEREPTAEGRTDRHLSRIGGWPRLRRSKRT